MLILGIDPGYAIVGFGVLQKTRQATTLIACGAINTPAGLPLSKRLLQISNDMDTLIAQFSPEVMAVEKLYFGNNVTTGIGVAQARGVILARAEQAGLDIFEYDPSQVKAAITGYGKAEKKQMMEAVRRLLNLSAVPKPDDAADAVAIALCHARSGAVLLAGL